MKNSPIFWRGARLQFSKVNPNWNWNAMMKMWEWQNSLPKPIWRAFKFLLIFLLFFFILLALHNFHEMFRHTKKNNTNEKVGYFQFGLQVMNKIHKFNFHFANLFFFSIIFHNRHSIDALNKFDLYWCSTELLSLLSLESLCVRNFLFILYFQEILRLSSSFAAYSCEVTKSNVSELSEYTLKIIFFSHRTQHTTAEWVIMRMYLSFEFRFSSLLLAIVSWNILWKVNFFSFFCRLFQVSRKLQMFWFSSSHFNNNVKCTINVSIFTKQSWARYYLLFWILNNCNNS